MKYKYILFDLDGTITESGPGIMNSVEYALNKMNREVGERDTLKKFIGPPLTESMEKYYGMSEEEALLGVKYYREYYAVKGIFENSVYEGLAETLESLKNEGYILAVATSKPEVYTLRILEHFDLFKYFTAVAGCDIHRAGETKADMIRLALRRLGLPEQEPPQTVMIGDRKHDVLGAKECRVPCIGVRYGYAEAGELEQYGADWVTDSVETLGKLLL